MSIERDVVPTKLSIRSEPIVPRCVGSCIGVRSPSSRRTARGRWASGLPRRGLRYSTGAPDGLDDLLGSVGAPMGAEQWPTIVRL